MEKKYTSPELNIVEFEVDDIIRTSGEGAVPNSLEGAEQLENKDFTVFTN